MWHLPNIFVSAVGKEVKGGEVAVHRQQVQTQEHHQHFNDDPHKGGARTQSQHLRTEPSHTHTHARSYLSETHTAAQENHKWKKRWPFLDAEGHPSQQNVGDERHRWKKNHTCLSFSRLLPSDCCSFFKQENSLGM